LFYCKLDDAAGAGEEARATEGELMLFVGGGWLEEEELTEGPEEAEEAV
jgi:hypothetical protein